MYSKVLENILIRHFGGHDIDLRYMKEVNEKEFST